MNHNVRLSASLLLMLGMVSHGQDAQFTERDLAASEELIDAFYSFDRDRLRTTLQFAEASMPSILFYQGWAEGGNYTIVERHGCEVGDNEVVCPVTVKDDLMVALGIAFDVTDTFHLSVVEGQIRSVTTSSNDLEVFRDAEEWVWNKRPELVEAPCSGFFNGGPTPGDCVRAMVRGYREYTQTEEYAAHLTSLEIPE